jgi:DNA end-binding protein Ku
MASRALWKGQLRLSLVSIPVEIHAARKSGSKIRFRQIHGPSGKPVHYQKVVTGVGPIDAKDIMKGYETDDGEYILIQPEEVDAIRLETKKTLELVQFVGACEIAPIWFDSPYYLVPTDDLAEDAYRVVRDALRKTQKIGLGQLTMRGKEYLCAVRPCGDGLLMETLHYEEDLRAADPLFASIEDEDVDEELLAVAEQLIERKTAPFDASAFQDHYAAALSQLVEGKVKSKKTPRTKSGGGEEKAPQATNVVDLMDALKKSLKETKAPAKRKTPARPSSKKSA